MPAILGFLTVRRHDEYGYFGGYLVLNQLARPLEFHCTLPVRPSRAQMVLYGPTIEDFVCGEQIGKALVSKAKIVPDLVITDSPCALAVSLVSDISIVQIDLDAIPRVGEGLQESEPPLVARSFLKLPQQTTLQLTPIHIGGYQCYAPERSSDCQSAAEQVLAPLIDGFDLCEPFNRIVEALMEAHPTTKAA